MPSHAGPLLATPKPLLGECRRHQSRIQLGVCSSEAHKVDAPDDGFSIDYRSESEDALRAFSEQGCTELHKAVIDSCSGA
jgi:hypothetical protein